jgi:hypothetical protein
MWSEALSKAVTSPVTGPASGKVRLLGAAAVAALLTLTAACGGNGTPTAANPGGSKATSGGQAPQSAFVECLRKNGVTLPSDRPSRSSARPSGSPGGRPSGRPGGQPPSMSPERQKAMEACRSLMPNGGQGRGVDPSAVQAFRACMRDHGVPISEGQGGRRFETTDPKVAKALATCRPLMPSTAPSPGAS